MIFPTIQFSDTTN